MRPDDFNVSSIKTAIVRTFLAAFVHTAWEELKYRNVSQLSCKTQLSGNKDSLDVAHRNKIQNELGL